MSNLVNIVKALLNSMFEFLSFEAKNRVFEFDPQYMNTFEFVRCSKIDVRVRSIKWCSTHHYLPCMQKMIVNEGYILFTLTFIDDQTANKNR